MDRESILSKVGCIEVTEDPDSDNLAIVLASYFESHMDRPVDDEVDEYGWGVWVSTQTDKALLRIYNTLCEAGVRVEE